jgi:hypothetical protein
LHRFAHVGVQAVCLAGPLLLMLGLSGFFNESAIEHRTLWVARSAAVHAALNDPAERQSLANDPRTAALMKDAKLPRAVVKQEAADVATIDQRRASANPLEQWRLRFNHADLRERAADEAERSPKTLLRLVGVRATDPWADDDLAPPLQAPGDRWATVWLIAVWPAMWVAWAFLTRGGLTLPLLGIAVVGADGRPARRRRCAERAVVVWLPVTVLIAASVLLQKYAPAAPAVPFVLWLAALALLGGYVALAVAFPRRAPHDRLCGTYLVPR